MIEYKSLRTEIKANDDMTFDGYASVFGNIDSYRDVVVKGAFTKTISENKNRIKVLWQHDVGEPIGRPIELIEDSKGLFVKAKLCNTDVGKKCYELMKDGVINELSIGYDVIKDDFSPSDRIRYLREVRLWEFSAVTFAANEMATVNNVKTIDALINELKIGRAISNTNKDKIRKAINDLLALIDEEEPSDDTLNSNKSQKLNDIDPDTIQLILEEMKKYKV